MFEDLGGALRTLRRRAGLSQSKLAQLAGLNRSSIYQFETGLVRPAIDTLGRLLAALNCSLQDLDRAMVGSSEPEPYPEPADDLSTVAEPAGPYRLFGRLLTRQELESKLDAAMDRLVRESLDAEPDLADEVEQRKRPAPRPAAVRDE
jgi:transcriptional regulator with XRE-family HTH domain